MPGEKSMESLHLLADNGGRMEGPDCTERFYAGLRLGREQGRWRLTGAIRSGLIGVEAEPGKKTKAIFITTKGWEQLGTEPPAEAEDKGAYSENGSYGGKDLSKRIRELEDAVASMTSEMELLSEDNAGLIETNSKLREVIERLRAELRSRS